MGRFIRFGFVVVYMRIGDYVAGKREWLNDGVRKEGNLVCGGLGDVLASDISPRRALSVGLAGLAIGGSVSNSGCASVVGGVVGYKLAEGASEDPRQINQERENKRQLVVQYWKDFNRNGRPDGGEVLGEVEGSVNLDEYGIHVSLTYAAGWMTFYVLDAEENRVSCTPDTRFSSWWTSDKDDRPTDFIEVLDQVSRKNPGEYTICANQGVGDKVFRKTIIITRNN